MSAGFSVHKIYKTCPESNIEYRQIFNENGIKVPVYLCLESRIKIDLFRLFCLNRQCSCVLKRKNSSSIFIYFCILPIRLVLLLNLDHLGYTSCFFFDRVLFALHNSINGDYMPG